MSWGLLINRLIGISGFNRYNTVRTQHRGQIIQVYVKPEFQGRNIGFDLVRSTLVEAFQNKEIKQVEIDVLENNKKAENMYSRLGFETYGLQKNYLKLNDRYTDNKLMYLSAEKYTSAKGR